MFDYVTFGAGVKFYRLRLKKTAEEFSETIDISVKHLRKIENGTGKPSLQTLIRICNTLNVGVKDCLHYTDDCDNMLYRQYKSEIKPLTPDERIYFTKVNNRLHLLDKTR